MCQVDMHLSFFPLNKCFFLSFHFFILFCGKWKTQLDAIRVKLCMVAEK